MLTHRIEAQLQKVLRHLYINPLEKCNLKCKICYTKKTAPILSSQEITLFVARYREATPLDTITFCGGEVFALASFPQLVNQLQRQGYFIQVITNGTIDVLDQIEQPNQLNLIVSLDGRETYHDANRGPGNFRKSVAFLQKAQRMGFHTHIFSILTAQNLKEIDLFEGDIQTELAQPIEITYHPRKPPAYLMHHPVSNIVGEVNGFDFLSDEEMTSVMRDRQVFPPKDLGCYQVALMSDGKVYGCCEGVTPIGTIDDAPAILIEALRRRLVVWENTTTEHPGCLGCSQSEFMCGIKKYLGKTNRN